MNNMRDIKFRAWDRENKTMIYKENMQSISWPNHLKDTKSIWVRCDGNVMGYFALMQYTGKKDKIGKEIYTGDIVKWYVSGRGPFVEEIKYDDELAEYNFPKNDDGEIYEVEKIGNVWEIKSTIDKSL
jgi:uncharacterized phage protein (TIGR01671 family)